MRRDPLVRDLSSELWPEEAVSVEQLIAAFTINGAYANFLEHETGSLEAGKSADLVVLRENILELPAERVNEATVELTLFRGAPTFAAGAYEGMDLALEEQVDACAAALCVAAGCATATRRRSGRPWRGPAHAGLSAARGSKRRAYRRRVDSRSSSDRGSSRCGSAGVSPRTSPISMPAASRPSASAL